jgi:hypothetical protein
LAFLPVGADREYVLIRVTALWVPSGRDEDEDESG